MHTIVIVDNEPFELATLERMLEDDAYRFETAFSGSEAKELLNRVGPDTTAILLDWVLPDCDGLELLLWIQSQPFAADTEVIVHSEEFVPENVARAIDCGAYYFLTKPFDEPQLEAIVRAAVETVEQRRKLERLARETRDAVRLLEKGVFRFRTIEEAELLAVHLASACGHTDLSLGLRELLVNAVEHGNLGITYDEKGRLLQEGTLARECRRRLSLPEYRNRHVEVTLQRKPHAMAIHVKDEGPGFDFEKYQTIDEARLFDSHGRGVLVASATLDLEYLPPGNRAEVSLPVAV
jgi:DNA-binding response OmpR family regulator